MTTESMVLLVIAVMSEIGSLVFVVLNPAKIQGGDFRGVVDKKTQKDMIAATLAFGWLFCIPFLLWCVTSLIDKIASTMVKEE